MPIITISSKTLPREAVDVQTRAEEHHRQKRHMNTAVASQQAEHADRSTLIALFTENAVTGTAQANP